ncbi:MAG: anaerobic sulfite reductase subunit AsrA, partial [Planctomycetota bacterium]
MGLMLTPEEFNQALATLGEEYDILAPKRFEARGRCSDTDLIRYGKVSSLAEIVWQEKSAFSPKDTVFPVTQTLFHFTEEEFRESSLKQRKMLVFLRPCDINGIRRLDTIYLKNGDQADLYYKRLRERVKFVMIECTQGFENCFCVSMGSNVAEDYAAAVRFGDDSVSLEVRDEALQKTLQEPFG